MRSETSPRRRPPLVALELEYLEARCTPTGFQPTAVEQWFLEQLNDARTNPAAYGASIGLDLSSVAPAQPLAFDTRLVQAARLHSQDMNRRAYFSHTSPEGTGPGERITAAGFSWTSWGESLAAGTAFSSPRDVLRGLIIDSGVPDLGHRRHLLAIDWSFKAQNQVGVGIVERGTGPYGNYYTIDTASGSDRRPFITGVVFNDLDRDGKYDLGEGCNGATVTVSGVGSTTTFVSGGYGLRVNPGTYTVMASGSGLASPITRVVTVAATNFRLNLPCQPMSPSQVWAQRLDASGRPIGSYFLTATSQVKYITVGRDAAGNMEVFAIGADDRVLAQKFDAAGNPSGSYFRVAAGRVKAITVTRDAANRPELFVIGLDDQVWALKFDASGRPVGNYLLVDAGWVKSIAAARDTVGRPLLFVVGLDDQVYRHKFDTSGNPLGDYGLAAQGDVRSITIGYDAAGSVQLFTIGLDDQVWSLRFDSNGNPRGNYVLAAKGSVKSIAVIRDAAGRPILFAVGLDDQVWAQKFNGSGTPLGTYSLINIGWVKAIATGTDGSGNPELFVIGLDDQVWAQRFDAQGNAVGSYFLTGAGRVRTLTIGRTASGLPQVFTIRLPA